MTPDPNAGVATKSAPAAEVKKAEEAEIPAPKEEPEALPESQGEDSLPDGPTEQSVNYKTLGWLFVAPPGFGKSEFFASFDDSLMLACEGGHKFIKCPKLIIDTWGGPGEAKDADGNIHCSFLAALKKIESSTRYEFVFIDTIDALVKKCIDYHVEKANQAHLSDLGDYGKGFDLGQNDPIRKAINRIFATERGIGLITHQEIKTAAFKKGSQQASKKETSLPNGIFKFVYPQMDIIIHGEFGGIQDGNEHKDRIIRAEGTEDILAKNRGGVLPGAWISPLAFNARGEQIASFFQKDNDARLAAIKAASDEYKALYVSE